MTVTSFLSDACHEMVTAILPGFFATVYIAQPLWAGLKGYGTRAGGLVKLGAAGVGTRIGHGKTIVAVGYFLTGTAFSAIFARSLLALDPGRPHCELVWFAEFAVPSEMRSWLNPLPPSSEVRRWDCMEPVGAELARLSAAFGGCVVGAAVSGADGRCTISYHLSSLTDTGACLRCSLGPFGTRERRRPAANSFSGHSA